MGALWLAVALDVLLTAKPAPGRIDAFLGRTKLGPAVVVDEAAAGVVLVDFAASAPEDHACLALELARVFPRLGGMPVYFTGATQTRLLYPADMATGTQFGLLTPADRLEPWCTESKAKSERKPVLRRDTISVNEVVRSLGWLYDRRPLRLYWIAGDFGVYDWRQYFGRPSRRPMPGDSDIVPPPVPGLVDFLLVPFAQPPITIFAAHLPGASREIKRSGQYLAEATGGLTGELSALLTDTAELPIARIEIPESERSHGPGLLRVRDSSGRDILHRPFTLERPPPDRPKLDPLVGRVVTYSTDMSVKSGCGGEKVGARFELDLPNRVREAAGRLLVHIEFQAGKRSLRQRLTLDRPGPLCVVPHEEAPGTKFLIVVHDPVTGWTGAKNATITSR